VLKLLKDAAPFKDDFSKRKDNRSKTSGGQGGFNKDRPDKYNKGGDYRGNRPSYRDDRPQPDSEWRKEEDEMEAKLKQQSKKFMEEAKSEKQDMQKVRLWLNQISPDNYDRKSGELRELLIGNAKLLSEPGFNEEEAKNMTIDDEKQTIVVDTIFRKAQKEHSYTAFYAKLCADFIKLELESRGMSSK
jgi:hypothetical protein